MKLKLNLSPDGHKATIDGKEFPVEAIEISAGDGFMCVTLEVAPDDLEVYGEVEKVC